MEKKEEQETEKKEENLNLKLWEKVEKTNPNYTKQANVKGNKITSIAPQYQIKNATEHFGSYGKTWGFRDIEIDYTLVNICGLIYWKAEFFYPDGSFPATNSISVWRDGAMTKADDQFAKKVETDALTKCLSKLGFNADIFLGKFDDPKYLEEVKKEFSLEDNREEILPETELWKSALVALSSRSATMKQIEKKYKISKENKKQLEDEAI